MAENWKSANWDELVSGASCPVCEVIQSAAQEDAHGFAVVDLKLSRLFLAKNQYVAGYCTLLCRQHVIEPYELTSADRVAFFDDLSLIGKGLQQAFKADKLNYQILGNMVPHLHVHVVPRYFTDDAPHRPIDPWHQQVYLSPTEYAERIALIQTHLGLG